MKKAPKTLAEDVRVIRYYVLVIMYFCALIAGSTCSGHQGDVIEWLSGGQDEAEADRTMAVGTRV